MPARSPSACAMRHAERDAGVLDRVVPVHVEVALRLDREVEQRVAGERLEHVVEEPDAGAHARPRPCRRAPTRTWRSVSLVVRRISPMRGMVTSILRAHADASAGSRSSAAEHRVHVFRACRSRSGGTPPARARPRRRAPGCRAPPAAAGTPPAPGAARHRISTKLAALGYTVSPGSAREPGQRGGRAVSTMRAGPRARAAPRGRSATAAAARVTTFTLYGSLPLASSRATAGMRQRQPEPEPGHAQRLGEGAQHDQPRAAAGAAAAPSGRRTPGRPRRTRPARRSRSRMRSTAPVGQGGAGRVVRRVEHDDPGPLPHRGLDQRVHVVREIGPERHRAGSGRRARR